MPADSDSTIAWHRAQLKQLRQTLKDIETSIFTVGEFPRNRAERQDRGTIAEVAAKDWRVSANHRYL